MDSNILINSNIRLQNKLKELQSLQDAQVLRPTLDDSSLQEKHIQDLTIDITRVNKLLLIFIYNNYIFVINNNLYYILFKLFCVTDICLDKKNYSANSITFKWTIW